MESLVWQSSQTGGEARGFKKKMSFKGGEIDKNRNRKSAKGKKGVSVVKSTCRKARREVYEGKKIRRKVETKRGL